MRTGFDIDALLANLAKRVAAELRAEMEHTATTAMVRPETADSRVPRENRMTTPTTANWRRDE